VSEGLTFVFGGFRTEVVFEPFDAAAMTGLPPMVTVLDENTAPLFADKAPRPIVLPAGESAKNWSSVESILAHCASFDLGRDGTIVGVGGGVVCDTAAFAASLYMRGCSVVLVPTTLLCMVDACLGGKTGIDFLGFKNLVGTFYPANRIFISAGILSSLSAREYLSGTAEAIKTGIIGDEEILTILSARRGDFLARDPAVVEEIVRRCLAVKGRIVEADPREAGERELLNLGHTFAHALESATAFRLWTHGEAVAWGIAKSLETGVRLGLTDPAFAGQVRELLAIYGYRLEAAIRYENLAPGFQKDKKRRSGRVRLVIPRGPRSLAVREVSEGDLATAIDGGARRAEKEPMHR
jgi:3-dehydroquinate synthase